MTPDNRMMVRPRHMALAAVVVALGLLVGTAIDVDAATHTASTGGSLPSPMLLLPVMLAFALRARD